jgi:hypothetical protein
MKKKSCSIRIALFAPLVLALCATVRSQGGPHSFNDQLALTRNFLRDLYPTANDKDYRLTAETTILYDQSVPVRNLKISVGYGPEGSILGYSGGCRGPIYGPASPLSTPTELPPSTQQAVPIDGESGKTRDCHPPGPIHPAQFLDSEFDFDAEGRLAAFRAEGPGIGHPDALRAFAGQVMSHPQWSDAELELALKQAGAKYTPTEKEAFVKQLPTAKLERFLGKLTVITVNATALEGYKRDVALLPDILIWTVKFRALRHDGKEYYCIMTFEQFSGDLTSIQILNNSNSIPVGTVQSYCAFVGA